MKSTTIILLTTISLFGFMGLSFSQQDQGQLSPQDSSHQLSDSDTGNTQENLEFIRGRIISINVKKNEIVIEQDQTHDKRTFVVSAERIPYFKIDDHVKIWVKPGENTAQDIQKIRIWHPHPTPPK